MFHPGDAMRVFTLTLLVLVTSLTGTTSAGQTSLQSGADDAAIVAVIGEYVSAREARDPKAIAALFTDDADQLVSSGEWRRGRDAVVKGTLASSAATGGTRSIEVETFRKVAPDVAVVDGRYEISGLAGGATRRMWSSFVLVRESGRWRISAIRNMLPAK
jgi:uncharacterized protein (TIGR02246 family)